MNLGPGSFSARPPPLLDGRPPLGQTRSAPHPGAIMPNACQSPSSPSTTSEENVMPLIPGFRPAPEAGRICPVLRPISVREGLDTVKEFCAFFRISYH